MMFKWIFGLLCAGVAVSSFYAEPITCNIAIAPLAVASIGVGTNILGKLMGGGQQQSAQVPEWLIEMLRGEVRNFRTDDFIEEFTSLGEAESQEILGQLPVGMEAFNAEAASRGVFTSGEGLSNLYSNVVTPVFRAAETARSGRRAQGTQMAHQLRQQLMQMLAGTIRPETPQRGFGQQIGDLLTEIGGFGTQLGAGQAMGVYPRFGGSAPRERVWA